MPGEHAIQRVDITLWNRPVSFVLRGAVYGTVLGISEMPGPHACQAVDRHDVFLCNRNDTYQSCEACIILNARK